MKAITSGLVSNRQLEAARKVIVRRVRKVGKIRIRVFPDVPVTKKGLEMPMGKGKGDVDTYKAAVRKGKVIFEINGVDRETAEDILIRAGKKLPLQIRVVEKGEIR
jgi:large subunit ribosomal protein L16